MAFFLMHHSQVPELLAGHHVKPWSLWVIRKGFIFRTNANGVCQAKARLSTPCIPGIYAVFVFGEILIFS
jgi:hypothetical protein